MVKSTPRIVQYLLYILLIALLILLVFLVSHTRTAFREKYQLPGCFPRGSEVWSMFADVFISVLCLPCSLAQISRHLFQYDRIEPRLGLFLGDPSIIPPLPPLSSEAAGAFERPLRADEAGLSWSNDSAHPDARDNRGATHRQEEILQRQRADLLSTSNPVPATAVATAPNIYKADGSKV